MELPVDCLPPDAFVSSIEAQYLSHFKQIKFKWSTKPNLTWENKNISLIILTDSYINIYRIMDISVGIIHLRVSMTN